MNIKLIKTGLLGVLLGSSFGLNAMAHLDFLTTPFNTFTSKLALPTFAHKIPGVTSLAENINSLYQQYPTQVKAGAVLGGMALGGLLHYAWRYRTAKNIQEPVLPETSKPTLSLAGQTILGKRKDDGCNDSLFSSKDPMIQRFVARAQASMQPAQDSVKAPSGSSIIPTISAPQSSSEALAYSSSSSSLSNSLSSSSSVASSGSNTTVTTEDSLDSVYFEEVPQSSSSSSSSSSSTNTALAHIISADDQEKVLTTLQKIADTHTVPVESVIENAMPAILLRNEAGNYAMNAKGLSLSSIAEEEGLRYINSLLDSADSNSTNPDASSRSSTPSITETGSDTDGEVRSVLTSDSNSSLTSSSSHGSLDSLDVDEETQLFNSSCSSSISTSSSTTTGLASSLTMPCLENSDGFADVALKFEPLATQEVALFNYVTRILEQNPNFELIQNGSRLLYALLYNAQLYETVKPADRKAYLSRINQLLWALFSYAVEKNEGFIDGTMVVHDPSGNLYKFLYDYVQMVNPGCENKPAVHKSKNAYAYYRHTTHYNKSNAFGIDMRWEENLDSLDCLPGKKKHFFFLKLQNDLVAIRMEYDGLYTYKEIVSHGAGAVVSTLRKTPVINQLTTSDDGQECRKERVPADFNNRINGLASIEEQKFVGPSSLRSMNTIGKFWQEYSNPIFSTSEQLEWDIFALASQYDNLPYRTGREVILTKRDLFSLAYYTLDQEAVKTLKEITTIIMHARALLQKYKQDKYLHKLQDISWIQQQIIDLCKKWPSKETEQQLLAKCPTINDVILDYKHDLQVLISFDHAPSAPVLFRIFSPEFKKLQHYIQNNPFVDDAIRKIDLAKFKVASSQPSISSQIVPVKVASNSTSPDPQNLVQAAVSGLPGERARQPMQRPTPKSLKIPKN